MNQCNLMCVLSTLVPDQTPSGHRKQEVDDLVTSLLGDTTQHSSRPTSALSGRVTPAGGPRTTMIPGRQSLVPAMRSARSADVGREVDGLPDAGGSEMRYVLLG